MAAGQKSGSESGGKKLLISILPSGVVPKSLRVRPGNQIAWFNGTSKECVVVFGTPTCPLEHDHGECKYSIPAGSESESFRVPGSVLRGEKRVAYQYAVRFKGRGPHRGTPRIIVSG